MNVSNNDSHLSTIKPWRKAKLKQRKASPFLQAQSKGLAWLGGVVIFSVALDASRDETAPTGWIRPGKRRFVGVSRRIDLQDLPPPPFSL